MKIIAQYIYPINLTKKEAKASNSAALGQNNFKNIEEKNLGYVNFKSNVKLSSEIEKAFLSNDIGAKKEYFNRILANHSFLLRNCTSSEYTKTLQILLDNIKFGEYLDPELLSVQIELLSKMAQPNVGLEKEINVDNFVENSRNFISDDDYLINKINRILRNLGAKNKLELDINSRSEYPVNNLSNFAETNFVFDGVKIKSMEGFLQSLKTNDIQLQESICQLDGLHAKGMGKKLNKNRNYDFEKLYWKNKPINRNSEEYQNLLKDVYRAKFEQDDDFRFALEYTKNYTLTHKLGGVDPKRTLLTQEEFISNLNALRDSI